MEKRSNRKGAEGLKEQRVSRNVSPGFCAEASELVRA
jgi:hypothetical protein